MREECERGISQLYEPVRLMMLALRHSSGHVARDETTIWFWEWSHADSSNKLKFSTTPAAGHSADDSRLHTGQETSTD